MPKVKKLNGALGRLGRVVELRELTVGQYLALQQAIKDADETEQSFHMLADMLVIDGEPIGWEKLQQLGMSEAQQALEYLNEMMGGGNAGNA